MKIFSRYILFTFIKKFFIILFFAITLNFLVDSINNKNGIDAFSFFDNIKEVFSFVFFVSSMWTIILIHKTRELVALETSSISAIKIMLVFLIFNIIFSIFYIFIYNEVILKRLSKVSNTSGYIKSLNLYDAEDSCTYNLLLFANINFLSDKFTFKDSEVLKFENCQFLSSVTIEDGVISKNLNDGIKITGRAVLEDKIADFDRNYNYSFDILKKYYNEKLDKQIYKSFIETILLTVQFKKFNIQTRDLEIKTFEVVNLVISFFYMTLVSFVFFFDIPPRGNVFKRIFIAVIFVSFVYVVRIILISYIKKSAVLSPFLIIIPSTFIFLFLFLIFILRKH